ncbi:MAG: hypothetical protein RBS19_01395 [Bacteroidales bacterium]|nr:hypothetical protein [Bacteroidales bacterium]
MKNKSKKALFTFGLTVFTFTVFLFSSCTSSNEKTSKTKMNEASENLIEAKADLNAAQNDFNQTYEAFKIESDRRIAENEKAIAKLKAENRNKAAKADFEKNLTTLERKNQSLKDRMHNYKDEGFDKWESFKTEFNHDMDNLGDALNDLTTKNTK